MIAVYGYVPSGMLGMPAMARMREKCMSEENRFGVWLLDSMQHRGIEKQTHLTQAAGIAQSTISMYIKGERKPEKREQVEKIVRGLLPKDASEHTSSALLNAALMAAGLAPIEYVADPAEQLVVEAYRNSDSRGKRHIESAAEVALETSRAGARGRRAE